MKKSNAGKLPKRDEIPSEFKWRLEDMYPSINKWEEDYKWVKEHLPALEEYRGRLTNSAEDLLHGLNIYIGLMEKVEKLFVYAHMLKDQDNANTKSQGLLDRAQGLAVEYDSAISFLVPEILEISEEKLNEYISTLEGLKSYKHFLGDLMRKKKHILSEKEEKILAMAGEVANAPGDIFSMVNDADMRFPYITNEDGQEVELTHGRYIQFLESKERKVRKQAFKALYETYGKQKNTIATTFNYSIKKDLFFSKIRNYPSTLEMALHGDNIPISVYDNLIKAVEENMDALHRYVSIRKKALKLDELHMYDVYTPIVKEVDFNIPYEEGVELIKKALSPLKEEYLTAMNEGFNSRWIDVYENRGKRSGAYSSGSYDSKPFILLNYHNTLDNVFTIAHEMGHSMHSYFTRKYQPFVYGNYSIFVAEVASTANEALLLDYMLKNAKDKNEKLYLLNHYLESFRTTLFRQTMFAEFELIINEYLEKGGALTAEYLCETYRKLNKLYYGPNMVIDDEIAIEWARIPHFYYNYYVFQYATGFSAAIDLSKKILEDEDPAVDRYMDFLKSGSSDYPINVLKKAGVDMTTKEPVDNAMKLFKELVDEFDKLI